MDAAAQPKIDFNNLHRGGDMYPTPDASTECAASAIPPPPQASTSRNPPPPQLSETPAKALPAVSKPLPPAAKPAPPARPTAQQVASRAISGPQPKAPPATTVRPDTGLISADDDALFADLDLDTDGFGGAADASSEGSELNVSFLCV